MNKVALTVEARTEHGKQAAKRLRRSGWVPGTLYGAGADPQSVKVEARKLAHVLHEAHLTSVIDLSVDGGESCQALLRDPVVGPVSDELEHIDIMRVSATSVVRIEVPIELTGRARGVEAGGVLDQVLHTLEIECSAMSIPEHISVDVTELEIGDHIAVGSLDLPGIRVLLEPTTTIVTLSAPRAEVEEEVPAEGEEVEGEATEPELVGRKKGEEEEADEGADEQK